MARQQVPEFACLEISSSTNIGVIHSPDDDLTNIKIICNIYWLQTQLHNRKNCGQCTDLESQARRTCVHLRNLRCYMVVDTVSRQKKLQLSRAKGPPPKDAATATEPAADPAAVATAAKPLAPMTGIRLPNVGARALTPAAIAGAARPV